MWKLTLPYSTLARTILEALVNMRGYFLTIWNQGVKWTYLFHPNVIPNLEKNEDTYSWG
jgi:hypothetical protein